VNNTSGTTWTATAAMTSGVSNGPLPFTVNYVDPSGNTGIQVSTTTNSSVVTVDKTPPTVTLSSDVSRLQVGATARVTFTLSEVSPDFNPLLLAMVQVSYGSLSNVSVEGTRYTADYTPPGVGQNRVTFSVVAGSFQDVAGNTSTGAPQLEISLNSTPEGTPPSLQVSQNDPDVVLDLTEGITDPDGDPIRVTNFSVGYFISENGGIDFATVTDLELLKKFQDVLKSTNLNGNELSVFITNSKFLSGIQQGKIVLNYQVTDGNTSLSVTATILINGLNDGPAAINIVQTRTYKVDEAGTKVQDVQGNDILEEILEGVTVSGAVEGSDPDRGDSVVYQINEAVAIASGSLTFNPDGTYSYVPEDHFYGEVEFEYFIEDSNGARNGPYTVKIIVAENPDDDGIPTKLESLGTSTDIDGDGIPDRKQNNISHFPMTSAADFEAAQRWASNQQGLPPSQGKFGAILVGSVADEDGEFDRSNYRSDPNAKLKDLSLIPIPDQVQANLQFNSDLFAFGVVPSPGTVLTDLDGDPSNGLQTRVILDLPKGFLATTYIKQTPTGEFISFKDDQDLATWDDGATLIDTDKDGLIDRMVITLTDNALGDFDPEVGRFLDPGGLGLVKPSIASTVTSGFNEGLATGTLLYDVNEFYTGSDVDLEGDSLTYTLSTSNAGKILEAIEMDALTGRIQVKDKDAFDFESFVNGEGVSRIEALVDVVDQNGYRDTATVRIPILNVDEIPRILTDREIDYLELQPVETIVVDVETLPDFQDVTTFSLVAGKDGDQVVIEAATGRLRFKNSPDYYQKTTYRVDIKATDINGKSDVAEFTLHIIPIDKDRDGVLDTQEMEDQTDPDDPCSLVIENQTDARGIANWDTLDCDGDGVSNYNEVRKGNRDRTNGTVIFQQDTDGDGIPDYMDTDDDGDGVLTRDELPDADGDGVPDDADDTDGDGIPDYLDIDDDGDGILTRDELPDTNGDGIPDDAVDTDGDGTPDYKDIDDDGDGVLTRDELPDTNGDGVPDDAVDSDGDGIPDYKDIDDDGDGVLTRDELPDTNGDGVPDDAEDTDGDGIPDYLDIDDDGDGILTRDELPDTNGDGVPDDAVDSDGDGVPDYKDIDDDGDGILTKDELPDTNGDGVPDDAVDTDGDGIPDYKDTDDDGDGVLTEDELPDTNGDGIPDDAVDTDGDGIPDYKDTDDDGDGVPTLDELLDANGDGVPDDAVDTDGDGIPNFRDLDNDGDGVPDVVEVAEGTDPSDGKDYKDSDGDEVPDYVESQEGSELSDPSDYKDSDGDGVPDYIEEREGSVSTDSLDYLDSDGDGVPDYIQKRSLKLSVYEQVVLLWGDKDYLAAFPTQVGASTHNGVPLLLGVSWSNPETVNVYKRGTYELRGVLSLPKGIFNPYGVTGILKVIVLPKPAPLDVTITNDIFEGSTDTFFIPVGAFVVNDPVDNIHVVSLLGEGYDNGYFEIIDNILFWNSADPAPGRTTFTVIIRVTDRDGNTLDKFFEIRRTRPSVSSLTIYNTFTPNGDRYNDNWGVPGIRFYRGARVLVFERGGTRVFYTENPDVRWDGTYKGKEMPVGSYYWVIEVPETGESRRGIVNLLRK
jgi:gliding motility-associated-like protein